MNFFSLRICFFFFSHKHNHKHYFSYPLCRLIFWKQIFVFSIIKILITNMHTIKTIMVRTEKRKIIIKSNFSINPNKKWSSSTNCLCLHTGSVEIYIKHSKIYMYTHTPTAALIKYTLYYTASSHWKENKPTSKTSINIRFVFQCGDLNCMFYFHVAIWRREEKNIFVILFFNDLLLLLFLSSSYFLFYFSVPLRLYIFFSRLLFTENSSHKF